MELVKTRVWDKVQPRVVAGIEDGGDRAEEQNQGVRGRVGA